MRAHRNIMNRTCTISLFLASVYALACSTETTPTAPIEPEPTSGSLQVTIEETGPRPDADGYEVSITPTQASPVVRTVPQGGGSLLLADLPLGVHVLRIEGLAAHCWVTGNHPRAFTVEPGKTTQVVVGIFCPAPGAVLVRTVTRGRDVAAAAYTVSIQGESALESSIGTNDSLLIGELDLPAGTKWFVHLSSVPDNCWVDRPSPEVVGQLRGATVRIEYAVVCIPRSSRIAFELGGGIYLTSGPEAVALSHFNFCCNRGPSLSPDRSQVVFSTLGPDLGGSDLYVVHTDASGGWVTGDGQGSFVGSQAWSPDGSRIVFWKGGESGGLGDIYVLNSDGEIRLTQDGLNSSPAWSPDGASIAFCRFEGDFDFGTFSIYRMSANDGSGVVKLVENACDPVWSPDGSKIAFTDFSLFRPHPDLAVARADGSGLIRLHPSGVTSQQEASRSPSWSPDGTQIAFVGGASSNRIWIVEFDGSTFGEPFPYRFGTAPSWR